MELKIASCCGKPVDVPTMNGTKLRCPWSEALDFKQMLDTLRSRGVSRFEGYGISVEFHVEQPSTRTAFMQDMLMPTAPAAAVCPGPVMHRVMVGTLASQCPQCVLQAAPPAPPDEETCTCGHKILTDHGMTGCYHGCEMSTCGRQGTAGDDA